MGVWTSTPHDATAGAVLAAAQWDATVRDGFNAFGAMSSYTPSWTGSTTDPAIGNGTIVGAYTQIQKTVLWRVQITMGSTTTYGSGAWRISLPVTATGNMAGAGGDIAQVVCYDTSGGSRKFRHGMFASTTYIQIADDDGTYVTSTVPFTWASGDSLWAAGWYEAA